MLCWLERTSAKYRYFYVTLLILFSEDKNQIVKRYVYSGTSGAASLQQFVEQNIYHRQGEHKQTTLGIA